MLSLTLLRKVEKLLGVLLRPRWFSQAIERVLTVGCSEAGGWPEGYFGGVF